MERALEMLTTWFNSTLIRKGNGTINLDTDMIEDGTLDSLSILNLIEFIETRFDVTLPIEEFTPQNFRSLRAIATLTQRLGGRCA